MIGANIPNPKAPAANCWPTSPLPRKYCSLYFPYRFQNKAKTKHSELIAFLLPVDVSLVAMTIAVARRVTAAAGNISAKDLMNRYNQKLMLSYPHCDLFKRLFVFVYGSWISQITTGWQSLWLLVRLSITSGVILQWK